MNILAEQRSNKQTYCLFLRGISMLVLCAFGRAQNYCTLFGSSGAVKFSSVDVIASIFPIFIHNCIGTQALICNSCSILFMTRRIKNSNNIIRIGCYRVHSSKVNERKYYKGMLLFQWIHTFSKYQLIINL